MSKTNTQEVSSIPVDQLILSTLQQILGMLQKFEGILISKPDIATYSYPVPNAAPCPTVYQPHTSCVSSPVEQNTSAPAEAVGTAASGWDLVNKDHPTAHTQPAPEKPAGVRKARVPKANKQAVEDTVAATSETVVSSPASSVHVPSTAALQPAADDFGLGL